MSQKFEDGMIHPWAFQSRKFLPAEFNYKVFDKEMLAIVHALQTWPHYVWGTEHKVTIFLDYQNLEYFTQKLKLNRCQARWAKILLEFDCIIMYRKGSLNQKTEISSSCLAYTLREKEVQQ